ncbi:MAG: ABC-type sugar transport system, permease component [Firmicutes bacterium]|nr:ABC-type sugar transport system, permease component [Bacillota bacterium]
MAHPAPAVGAAGNPNKRRAPSFNWGPYLLLLPSLILLAVFTLWPMVASGYLALFTANMAHKVPVYNGIANFKDLFTSDLFIKAFKNTLLFAVVTIPASVVLAMWLATQLNRKLRSVAIVRAAFFYPTMLPLVSAAAVWSFFYNPSYGPVNLAIKLFGGATHNWLGDPKTALPAIMLVSIWKDAGYFMIFFLAGLQSLPSDLFEAAELDGASRWQQFWRITFPLLSPTTLFVATLSLINAFKTMDQIFVMTGGGPENATQTLLYFIYQQTFEFMDRGTGAAASAVLIVILLAVAVFNQFYVDKKVHYD